MRRAVEDTSTVFVVLAQETNAKSCASLVLRVEKEAIEWSLPKTLGRAEHTQGCLVESSTHSAEMMRSFLRRKKPLFIDRTKKCDLAGPAHFQLSSDKKAEEEAPLEAEAELATEASAERVQSQV
jgi:hypothetical protein